MNGPTTVLMYHAVLDAADADAGADRHYSVDRGQFLRHIDAVRSAGQSPASVRSLLAGADARGVGFTFDDGHASNEWAAQRLADAGGSADFFVNTTTVGTAHFLSWAALRDMAGIGMSIQSHGHHHRYLDELSPAEVDDELQRSRALLEDRLGRRVELFAPPGGRVSPGLHAAAARAGYTAVCSSRVDLWRDRHEPDIPRFAVLAETSDAQLSRCVRQDAGELLARRVRAGLLNSGKRLLGNQGYEKLRGRLLKLAAKR